MGFGDLQQAGIGLVVVGIVLVVGLSIMGGLQDDQTAGTAEYNATSDAMSGLSELSTWLPIIGLVVAAVVILGFVFMIKTR